MRAITYGGQGGVEVIALGESPDPVPVAGQIRVRVEAAGLNRADILQRRGSYPAPPGWPAEIPGLEYAGVVDGLGAGVTRWKTGDRVMGLVGGGAHAEMLVVNADEAIAAPGNLSMPEAAAIPEAFLTAYDALHTRARLLRGECVLIHAVASGLGTAAVQLAKVIGATTVGTTRSAGKLAALKALGLDFGIDSSSVPFREQVPVPVHVVLDVLGGPAFQDNLAVLEPRGRLVMLGFLQGAVTASANLDVILRKRLEVIGSAMRSRGAAERSALAADFSLRALPLFGPHIPTDEPMHSLSHPARVGALLRPVLHAVYPMTKVAAAHRDMERDSTIGKVVLSWSV